MLSITLTASVLFPDRGEETLLALLGGGTVFTVAISAVLPFCGMIHVPVLFRTTLAPLLQPVQHDL